MLMRLMSKGEYLIVPKGTKFTGSGKLGLKYLRYKAENLYLDDCYSNNSNLDLKQVYLISFSLYSLLKILIYSAERNNFDFQILVKMWWIITEILYCISV